MMRVMKRVFGGPAKYPLIVSLVVIVLFALGWWLLDGVHISVLMPSGQIAEHQRSLIILTVSLAAIVVIPVFIMLAAFAWKYREQNKKATYTPEWSTNKWLETIWWGIPIVIILVLSTVTWFTSHSLDPYRKISSSNKTIEVQVVALQWKWLFIYPDQGVATVNDLTIPVDTPVHFSLSADAPMSAFWIPDLGSQIYSMNGMSSQLNLIGDRTGTFTGYNTNINGSGYADMKFRVNVVSSEEFTRWHETNAKSGHVLNEMHFSELQKPNLVPTPMYMSLEDKDLYETIVARYMHGMSSKDDTKSDDMDSKGTMDHTMNMDMGEGTM